MERERGGELGYRWREREYVRSQILYNYTVVCHRTQRAICESVTLHFHEGDGRELGWQITKDIPRDETMAQ